MKLTIENGPREYCLPLRLRDGLNYRELEFLMGTCSAIMMNETEFAQWYEHLGPKQDRKMFIVIQADDSVISND